MFHYDMVNANSSKGSTESITSWDLIRP